MPIVIVYGLPAKMQEAEIEGLYEKLSAAVVAVEELGLRKDQITFFFPPDRMEMDLGKEIIIFVEGLFEKPERTEEVRNRLARSLGKAAEKAFPYAELIECLVRPFDPAKSGFWSSAI